MRFFSKEWFDGSFTDKECEEVEGNYQKYVDGIFNKLTLPLRLLHQNISLHDAVIRHVDIKNITKCLMLVLIVGDKQFGYNELTLAYYGCKKDFDFEEINRYLGVGILSNEIEVESKGRYKHDFMFKNYSEFSLSFNSIELCVKDSNYLEYESVLLKTNQKIKIL